MLPRCGDTYQEDCKQSAEGNLATNNAQLNGRHLQTKVDPVLPCLKESPGADFTELLKPETMLSMESLPCLKQDDCQPYFTQRNLLYVPCDEKKNGAQP